MKELAAWVKRLHQIQPTDLAEYLFRAVVPGMQPLEMRGCMVATNPLGQIPARPGDSSPVSVSVFRFLDIKEKQPTLQSHQLVYEIAALLTIATERRIEIPAELTFRVKNSPQMTFVGYGDAADRRLIGPVSQDSTSLFLDWLGKVTSLPEPHLSIIGTACNLHYGAVLLYHQDLRSAYLLLIAAIEVLSRQYGAPPIDWREWEGSTKWDKLMSTLNLTDEQKSGVREHVMEDKHLRLKATFKNYGATSTPDSFWEQSWQDYMCSVNASLGEWGELNTLKEKKIKDLLPHDRVLLAKSLGLSYDLRSGLVHRGAKLSMLEAILPHNEMVKDDTPLPFALLRSVLLELIKLETAKYSSEIPLPECKLLV